MKNGQILRAPKARHCSDTGIRDDHDFFTDSETCLTATRERGAEGRERSFQGDLSRIAG